MPAIVKITSPMFPEVYGSLLRDWNSELSETEWRSAFVPHWTCAEDHFGYALTDGGRIVGMLGTIFSERSLGGRSARFCNLHAWIVKPEYRARSLALLRPVLSLRDYTFTDFTASTTVTPVMKRLGFKRLDSTAIVLPPAPLRERRPRATVVEMAGSPEQYVGKLEPRDVRIYGDHLDFDCGHLLARVGDAYCYVVYSRIDRHALPYCLVHYISHRRLFAKHHAAIRSHLLRQTGSNFAAVDSRMLGDVKVPFSFRVRMNEKLFLPTDVAPHEIDTLYSEMVFLKHTTFPGLRQMLRSVAHRCLPAVFRDPALQAG